MREAPTYRLELEELLAYFQGKRILTVTDVSNYVGHSRRWCRDNLEVSGSGVSIVSLAKKLSELA